MTMNKSLFILLTGSLAATACYINTVPNNPPAPPPPPAPTAAAPTAAPPPAAPVPPSHHLSPHSLGLKGTPIDADAGAPPPAPTPAPSACLDNGAATAVDCTAMTDKSCAWAQKRCAAYNQYLKPKVAAQAAGCTTQAKDACSAQSALTCGVTAMKSACADPQVAQLCAQLAPTCKDSVDNCTAILSSLNAAGQQAAAQACANPTNCSAGVGACVDKALFPPATDTAATTARPKY